MNLGLISNSLGELLDLRYPWCYPFIRVRISQKAMPRVLSQDRAAMYPVDTAGNIKSMNPSEIMRCRREVGGHDCIRYEKAQIRLRRPSLGFR